MLFSDTSTLSNSNKGPDEIRSSITRMYGVEMRARNIIKRRLRPLSFWTFLPIEYGSLTSATFDADDASPFQKGAKKTTWIRLFDAFRLCR